MAAGLTLQPLFRLPFADLESPGILRATVSASRALAELKGVAHKIPHPGILINTLALQEAKDSAAIENIVTTHDDLFRADSQPEESSSLAAKEVRDYARALRLGHQRVVERGVLTNNDIVEIQSLLIRNDAGFRRQPGTTLRRSDGVVVYTPPQDSAAIVALMDDLERFINDDAVATLDPLVKMAIIHHQFESIHPFYDGNGRTGRVINVLYLLLKELLDLPVLYLSRYIVRFKGDYYRLLQDVRDSSDDLTAWHAWIDYVLAAVESTARQTIGTIREIDAALLDYKHRIRASHKFYSQDLINNLFTHPYTRIAFIERDLSVSRVTATRYLEALVADGLLDRMKAGRTIYYVNRALRDILTRDELIVGAQ